MASVFSRRDLSFQAPVYVEQYFLIGDNQLRPLTNRMNYSRRRRNPVQTLICWYTKSAGKVPRIRPPRNSSTVRL